MNAVTPLHKAAKLGNLGITQLLLSHDAVVNTLDDQGGSPLHEAVRSQKLDLAELSLQSGADVNVRQVLVSSTPEAIDSGNFGITQLLSRKFDVVELLFEGDADVNIWNIDQSIFDHWGDSPLHKAVRS